MRIGAGSGSSFAAAFGSAAGAILGSGGAIRRAALAVVCGALAVPAYFVAFTIGAFTFLDVNL